MGVDVAHLPDLVAQAAQESPDRVAVVDADSGRRVTWAELDDETERVSRSLTGMGLVAGYRVAVALPNRLEFVTAYLGALRARLVVVPVNPRATTGETVRILADCGARAVLADDGTLTTVRSAVAGLEDALAGADPELRARAGVPRVVALDAPPLPGETGWADVVGRPDTSATEHATGAAGGLPGSPDPESVAVLLYTSGTSGHPKAAMLTHRALLANIEQAAALDPPVLTPDDVVLCVLPLFHVYGLNAVLGQVLRQRARAVLSSSFDPEGTLRLIEEEAVTVVPVAPAVFGHWRGVSGIAELLKAVRLVLSGSAPLAPEVVDEFEARSGVPVHQGYGLTEAAPVVTTTRASGTVKRGSVGSPLPGIELKLVDESGQRPEGADPGEIWIRGENLFSGYWPDGEGGPGPDGWWATGDIGFLDQDGDLFLVDRLKDLVIVSGFNVYPAEVEETITELDSVAEAAVVGIPDDQTGERVVAYVRQRSTSGLSADEVAEQVRQHCVARLARFKQPAEVHVVTELPHTATGNVARGRLRDTERRRHLGLLE